MKSFLRLAGSALIVLTCWTAIVWAETRYISDQLVVSLREKPQKGAATITYMKTDMSVEVLEDTGEYTKVQTKAGEIGYIQSKYLTAATPKQAIIKKLQQERDRLASKTVEMKQKVDTATSQNNKSQQEMATQLDDVRRQVKDLQNALAKSQADLMQTNQSYQALQNDTNNITTIIQERDQLRKTNHELSTAITSLDEEVGELTKTGVIKWFLAGAGVLFLGWIIGKASGSRRRRLL